MPKRTQTRFIARMIEGAVPSDMPGFISPQLATLKARAPAGSKWIHEIKYDGYRLQIHLNKGVRIFTATGMIRPRFPVIAGALSARSSTASWSSFTKGGRTSRNSRPISRAASRGE